jgi:hypothetical protein
VPEEAKWNTCRGGLTAVAWKKGAFLLDRLISAGQSGVLVPRLAAAERARSIGCSEERPLQATGYGTGFPGGSSSQFRPRHEHKTAKAAC